MLIEHILFKLIKKCIDSSLHVDHYYTCKEWVDRSFERQKINLFEYTVLNELNSLKLESLEREFQRKWGIPPHLLSRENKIKQRDEYLERLSKLRVIRSDG